MLDVLDFVNVVLLPRRARFVVCCAPFAQADEEYSQKMFSMGLLAIVIGLTKNDFAEVAAEALRCISALCPAIASEAFDRYCTVDGR